MSAWRAKNRARSVSQETLTKKARPVARDFFRMRCYISRMAPERACLRLWRAIVRAARPDGGVAGRAASLGLSRRRRMPHWRHDAVVEIHARELRAAGARETRPSFQSCLSSNDRLHRSTRTKIGNPPSTTGANRLAGLNRVAGPAAMGRAMAARSGAPSARCSRSGSSA